MIIHYLKVALRNLWNYRTHCCISVICLAVGITFFTLVTYLINEAAKEEDLPRSEQRILFHAMRDNYGEFLTWEEVCFLQSQQINGIDSLLTVCSYFSANAEITLFDKNQREFPHLVRWKNVSPNYFDNQGYEFIEGSQSLTAPDEIIVSESFARRALGNQSPVGLTIRVDIGLLNDVGIKDFRIVNVCKLPESSRDEKIDIYFHPEISTGKAMYVVGFLNGKATLENVNEQLQKVVWPGNQSRITSCRAGMEFSKDTGRELTYLFVKFLSSLILLSGIINFLKFIIQMFYNRQRELGIRQCLGSNWKGIFGLLFSEVFWVISAAFFFSCCLSEISIALINHIMPTEDMVVFFSMGKVLPLQCFVYLGLLVFCMIIVLFPVYKLRKTTIIQPIMQRNNKHIFRYSMIGLQLGISIFFVGGVWAISLFFNNFIGESYKPLTEEEEQHILAIPSTTERLRKNWDVILQRIQTLPGYEGHTHLTSINSFSHRASLLYQKNEKEQFPVLWQQGAPNSFDFFHIPMTGKRTIDEGSNRVYVSERLMQRLQADGNTGTIRLSMNDYQIAGVYKELYKQKIQTDKDDYFGSVFFPHEGKGHCFLKFAPGTDMKIARKSVEAICRAHVPETLPLTITPLNEMEDEQVATIMLVVNCGILLGIVSLILVVLSVYSAISIDTVGRQKEIAIRKINGATSKDIARLFAKPYVVVYLLSFVCVFPLLRLFLIELSDGQLEAVYQWSWVIGLFLGFALLLFMITAQKIWQIMHIQPADIIKKE
ncbi:MAG: ABC transporter permease [Bacteroidaceae bacterium]|nr:ABC transporter permease [Bacteroidaceae bacterium]